PAHAPHRGDRALALRRPRQVALQLGPAALGIDEIALHRRLRVLGRADRAADQTNRRDHRTQPDLRSRTHHADSWGPTEDPDGRPESLTRSLSDPRPVSPQVPVPSRSAPEFGCPG